jgi:hypothetical protein
VHLKQFGIRVNPQLLTVLGRILNPPALQYRTRPISPNNGAWNLDVRTLGDKPFFRANRLTSWNCLIVNTGRETIYGGIPTATDLLRQFRETLNQYGMNPGPVQQPAQVNLQFDDIKERRIGKIQDQIKAAVEKGFKTTPQFLFVILPSDNAVVYDCIKYVFDVDKGIPNICSIGQKLSKEARPSTLRMWH